MKIIIIVHTESCEHTLKACLGSTFSIISLKNEHHNGIQSTDDLLNQLNLLYAQMEPRDDKEEFIVIVESNYGSPSEPVINTQLLDAILKVFSESDIFAFSRGTPESLFKALNYSPRLYALTTVLSTISTLIDNFVNVAYQNPDDAANLRQRIFNIKTFKDKLLLKQPAKKLKRAHSLKGSDPTSSSEKMNQIPFWKSLSSPQITPLFQYQSSAGSLTANLSQTSSISSSSSTSVALSPISHCENNVTNEISKITI